MDELDSEILRYLQFDARQTNRELARRLGIAPSTCLERTRALRARGAIRGYHAEVDLETLGRGVQALVHIQLRPLARDVIESFKSYSIDLPEVLDVYVVAGGDDFMLHVAVPGIDHLHGFLMDKMSKRREVVSFRSSIIYQHSRKRVLTPMQVHHD